MQVINTISSNKNRKIIAFFSTLIWLGFVFAGFNNFYFWYGGFVLFFFLAIGAMNYDEKTGLWLFTNRPLLFTKFYAAMIILSFFADFAVGQELTNLWTYPHYNSFDDFLRIYLILYPFGGLAVLELSYFISRIFGEKIAFVERPHGFSHKIADNVFVFLLAIVSLLVLLSTLKRSYQLNLTILWAFLLWIPAAIIKFKFHLKHWTHLVYIFTATYVISIFLHEIPNVGTYEWKYNTFPFFGVVMNKILLGIPVWVILGWWVLVLGMFWLWVYLVIKPRHI